MAGAVLFVVDPEVTSHNPQILDAPVARIIAHLSKDLCGVCHDLMVSLAVPFGETQMRTLRRNTPRSPPLLYDPRDGQQNHEDDRQQNKNDPHVRHHATGNMEGICRDFCPGIEPVGLDKSSSF